jgi:hypothetical protein
MKIVDNIKKIGHAIANGYRRLGEVDCPDQENIETSTDPNLKECKESLEHIKMMEEQFKKATTSPKAGKGNTRKNLEIKQVEIDTNKAIRDSKNQKEQDIQENVR